MRRILVVDDDTHTRVAIGAWLSRYGFRGAMADGSTSGLAALGEASFDLMIVDIFMPNMRGFEAIRLFHERAPTVPLIAISGYAFAGADAGDPACLKMAQRLGATRCLRKPFRPTTLLNIIDACLSEAEPHRRQVTALANITANARPDRGGASREDSNGRLGRADFHQEPGLFVALAGVAAAEAGDVCTSNHKTRKSRNGDRVLMVACIT